MRNVANALALFAICLLAVLIGGLVYGIYRLVEVGVARVNALWDGLLFEVVAGALAASIAVILVAGTVAVARKLWLWSRTISARNGQFPLIEAGHDYANYNEPGAQTLAAIAAAAGRVSAPTAARVAREHLNPQPPNVRVYKPDAPALPAPRVLTLDAITRADPRHHPHWLEIGGTGAGKTIASYYILERLAASGLFQFAICEPGGVHWGNRARAITTYTIAEEIAAMHAEMERRQALLRQHDVGHVYDLPSPLACQMLVIEEIDTVLDDLRMTDKAMRTSTIVKLRGIARMGRAAGICLFAVSQSGTMDVFDSHVRRNMSNVLIFRSQPSVTEAWLIKQSLMGLSSGQAWSVRHGGLIQFPYTPRPDIIDAVPLQLPQPVAREGTETAYNRQLEGAVEPVATGCAAVEPILPRLQAREEPDTETAAMMRELYAQGWSLNALCRKLYGYKTDWALVNVKRALGLESEPERLS